MGFNLPESAPRFSLPHALAAWGTPGFGEVFKLEVEQLDASLLPLQQGLTGTSAVADEPHSAMLLGATVVGDCLRVRAGIFYAGLLGGCSCADDPTPTSENNEYCEVQLDIDKTTAATAITLVVK